MNAPRKKPEAGPQAPGVPVSYEQAAGRTKRDGEATTSMGVAGAAAPVVEPGVEFLVPSAVLPEVLQEALENKRALLARMLLTATQVPNCGRPEAPGTYLWGPWGEATEIVSIEDRGGILWQVSRGISPEARLSEFSDEGAWFGPLQLPEPGQSGPEARVFNSQVADLPWSDCKVAFGFDCDSEKVWQALWPEESAKFKLPAGWSLCETDGAGARDVAVFRVEVPLRPEDGEAVAAILKRISEPTPYALEVKVEGKLSDRTWSKLHERLTGIFEGMLCSASVERDGNLIKVEAEEGLDASDLDRVEGLVVEALDEARLRYSLNTNTAE